MEKSTMHNTKEGRIISNKMKNTLVVEVSRINVHPIYKKQIKLTKKYHVHCEDESKYAIGQIVKIKPSKPFAKTVSWEIINNKEQK